MRKNLKFNTSYGQIKHWPLHCTQVSSHLKRFDNRMQIDPCAGWNVRAPPLTDASGTRVFNFQFITDSTQIITDSQRRKFSFYYWLHPIYYWLQKTKFFILLLTPPELLLTPFSTYYWLRYWLQVESVMESVKKKTTNLNALDLML